MNRRWFVKLIGALPLLGVAGSPPTIPLKKVPQPELLQLDLIPIAGMKYHPISEYPLDGVLHVGDELRLVREPENVFDKRAIAMYTRHNIKCGYVPAYANRVPARLLDDGVVVRCVVEEVHGDADAWRKVWVSIRTEVLR